MARLMRTDLQSGHSHLGPPVVVNAPPVFSGPEVKLAPPTSVTTANGRPARYRLDPPTVVVVPVVYAPIRVTLAPSQRRPGRVRLSPPAVVAEAMISFGPGRRLAAMPTQRGINVRQAHPRLRGPVVVFGAPPVAPADVRFNPAVEMSTRRPPTRSRLAPPTVVNAVAAEALSPPVRVTLARIRPAAVHPRLPTTVYDAIVYPPVKVALAYSRRGKTTSRLAPPVLPPVARPIAVTLVRIRPARTRPRLPQVVYQAPVAAPVAVHLAPSRRPKTRSRLAPPILPPVARPVAVTLTRIRPARTRSELAAPTVVNPTPLAPALRVALARIRPPRTHLRLPQTVYAAIVYAPVAVSLAYSRRGRTVYRLAPPVLPPLARPLRVTLVRIRPARTNAVLGPPTVVNPVVVYSVSVKLAYSRRGRPIALLAAPTVVNAAPLARPPVVRLAKTPRTRTTARLAPPVLPPVAPPVRVTLARIRPPLTKAVLSPPTVVAAATYPPTRTTLTRIRPPAVRAVLRPPAVVIPAPLAPPTVVRLAPSHGGKTTSVLRPPILPPLARPVTVTLAPQRRGRPLSKLRAPQVVTAASVYPSARVYLAYSRRGRPVYRLSRPVVVRPPFVAPPLRVTLAAVATPALLLRKRPRYRLGAPTRVLFPAVRPAVVHLTYSRRGVPRPRLAPPAVVGSRPAPFRPILVSLTAVQTAAAFIRRRVHSRLAPPTVVGRPVPPPPRGRGKIGGSGFPRDWIEKRLAMLGLPDDLDDEEIEALILLGLFGGSYE